MSSEASAKQTEEQTQEIKKSNDAEINFAKMRKKMEEIEKSKLEAEARAQMLEKELENARKSKESVDEDVPSDEPYVDERRLQKKFDRFEREFSKKVDEKAEQKARKAIEDFQNQMFLKQNPDFFDILSVEMIDKLKNQNPEVAEHISQMPDTPERQKLLYHNIKALGLHKPQQPSIQDTIDRNKQTAAYMPSGVAGSPYISGSDFSEAGKKSAFDKVQQLKQRMRLG